MSSGDTSEAALRVQFELLRRTTGPRRITMAVGLTSLAHELTLAGIRARHPKATGEQVGHEYCKLAYGAELAEQVRAERLRRRAAGERRD